MAWSKLKEVVRYSYLHPRYLAQRELRGRSENRICGIMIVTMPF